MSRSVRAALFDVDGTLVDTNYLHAVTWWEAFVQAGYQLPMADIHRAIGMGSDQMLDELLPTARTVYAELGRFAVSSRLYPPQAPDLAGQQTPMVLNAAYLVADERAGEFAAAMADLTARHRFVQLTLTGPWPAYSFAGEGDGPGPR